MSIVTSSPRRGGEGRAPGYPKLAPPVWAETEGVAGRSSPEGGVIGDMLLTPSSHWHGGRVRVYRLGVNGCP